jgi:hypothetical protein
MVEKCIYGLKQKDFQFLGKSGCSKICEGCEHLTAERLKKMLVVQPSIYKEPDKEPIFKGKEEFPITLRVRIDRKKDPEKDPMRGAIEVCRSAEKTEDDTYSILFKCRNTNWSYRRNLVEEDYGI